MPRKETQPRGRELRRIRWIRRLERPTRSGRGASFPVGIGDDAAIWTPRKGLSVVLTVDTQVEGVHYRRDWLTPREIGRRAVAVAVSDLAAMAARPVAILVSILAREETSESAFKALHTGIRQASRQYGVTLLGGNLSAGPDSITVTALGEGKESDLITRGGARAGDDVWVTGTPGLARLGRRSLETDRRKRPRPRQGTSTAVRAGIRAFKTPTARTREALTLARGWGPTAMIDLSDGLATDLAHILEESAPRRQPLGAELDRIAFLKMQRLARLASELGEDPLSSALGGGDDYELCFTAPPRLDHPRRAAAFKKTLKLEVTRIGRIVKAPGIRIVDADGSMEKVRERGWEHF
jgi:thiamine-monophosphate kinase